MFFFCSNDKSSYLKNLIGPLNNEGSRFRISKEEKFVKNKQEIMTKTILQQLLEISAVVIN